MKGQSPFSIDKSLNPNYSVDETNAPAKPKKQGFLIGFIVLFVFIFLGLGVVLAVRAWDPLWNPFRPSPQRVLLNAFNAQKNIETQRQKAHLSFNLDNNAEYSFSIEFNFESDTDTRDKESLKSQTKFDIGFHAGLLKFPIAGEARIIGEDTYFKIDTFPLKTFLGLFLQRQGLGPDTGAYNSYEDIMETRLETLADKIVGNWIRISPKDLGMEFSPPKEEERKLNESIENLLLKYPVLKVEKELSDKIINDHKKYHYLLSLDRENLKPFLWDLLNIAQDSGIFPLEEETRLRENEKAEMFKSVDEFFDKIGTIETEIWIDKETYFIHKIKGEKLIDLSKIEKDEQGLIKIIWDMYFSNFNQPVEIIAPKDYTNIIEALGPIFMMGL